MLRLLLPLILGLVGCWGDDAHIATISGRYWAMDRDQRWDRVQRAWNAIVEADADDTASDALTALHAAYGRGENDEFVKPTVIASAGSDAASMVPS